MTQAQLEQKLARQIGESRRTIRRRGFSLVELVLRRPLVMNWDRQQADRIALFPDRQSKHPS